MSSITFSGSGTGVTGAALAAKAIFDLAGNTLTITLINDAWNVPTDPGDNTTSDKDVPGNTLTGVFFDLAGNPTLTPGSATIVAGSLVQGGTCSIGPCGGSTTNVGGEFRYNTGSWPGGAGYGIASSGYIGGAGNFGGPNLDNPNAVDGINFGIISNDPSFIPNGGLESEPLIRNQVVFLLTWATAPNVPISQLVSNVSFQYGTDLNEPNIPSRTTNTVPVPEPLTVTLLGLGLAALGLYRRRAPRA